MGESAQHALPDGAHANPAQKSGIGARPTPGNGGMIMAEMTLYIGNRNYSSWSLRAWLLARHCTADLETVLIPLDQPETRIELLRVSPAGLVPVLKQGELVIWDSLAIAEYLAERYPDRGLWPEDPARRARARAISAEMHAGFAALRQHLPMNLRSSFPGRGVTPEVQTEINRITAIWREQRRAAADGADGPFLFGRFTAADAMYAPVVSRFRTYHIELDDIPQSYAEAVWSIPAFQEWQEEARHEPMLIESCEF
jgi:glutathione S-transferase